MTNDLAEQIAWALETDPCLLPFMPELLADLNEPGASAVVVVSALRRAGLLPKATVLDLGCGKGAVAIALAERPGCYVEGVDAFLPFVEAARATASARGVEARCVFRRADLRSYLGRAAQYDAVLLLSVGPAAERHRHRRDRGPVGVAARLSVAVGGMRGERWKRGRRPLVIL